MAEQPQFIPGRNGVTTMIGNFGSRLAGYVKPEPQRVDPAADQITIRELATVMRKTSGICAAVTLSAQHSPATKGMPCL